MPNILPVEEEGVDFSKAFDTEDAVALPEEIPSPMRFNKKVKYLIILFLVLLLVQVVILVFARDSKEPDLSGKYQVVSPPGKSTQLLKIEPQ